MLKIKYIRAESILKAAKGEDCTMNSEWCNYNPQTTVAAHSNLIADGHGKGIKAHDCFVAFLCSDCHRWLDQGPAPRLDKYVAFHRAMKKTWLKLINLGLIKIECD